MSLRERVDSHKKEDPRQNSLRIGERYVRNMSPDSAERKLLELGFFDVVRDLYAIDPNIVLNNVDDESSPVIYGFAKSSDHRNFHYLLLLRSEESIRIKIGMGYEINGKFCTNMRDSEAVSLSELKDKVALEEILFENLKAAGFFPDLETGIVSKPVESEEPVEPGESANYDPDDFFAVLNIHPFAFRGMSDEQAKEFIKKMWRMAADRAHPDHGGTDEAMRKVNTARDYFMDPKNRTS